MEKTLSQNETKKAKKPLEKSKAKKDWSLAPELVTALKLDLKTAKLVEVCGRDERHLGAELDTVAPASIHPRIIDLHCNALQADAGNVANCAALYRELPAFVEPPAVHKHKGKLHLVRGDDTLAAALEAGMEKIEVLVYTCSPEEAFVLAIRLHSKTRQVLTSAQMAANTKHILALFPVLTTLTFRALEFFLGRSKSALQRDVTGKKKPRKSKKGAARSKPNGGIKTDGDDDQGKADGPPVDQPSPTPGVESPEGTKGSDPAAPIQGTPPLYTSAMLREARAKFSVDELGKIKASLELFQGVRGRLQPPPEDLLFFLSEMIKPQDEEV